MVNLKDIKLINFKDMLKLWRRFTPVFVVAILFVIIFFTVLEKLPQEDKYLAKTAISLNYSEDSSFDYDTSVLLAQNFSKFEIENSKKSEIIDKVENGDISLKNVLYTNLIYADAVAKDKDEAIMLSNKLADIVVNDYESIISSDIKGKINYKIEQRAEDAKKIIKYDFSKKDKVSMIIATFFIVNILAMVLELWRTNIKTIEEAKEIGRVDFVVNTKKEAMFLFMKDKTDQNALELIKQSIGRDTYFVGVTSLDEDDSMAKYLGYKCTKSLLENSDIIENLKNKNIVLQIKKCDYRNLRYAKDICDKCNINVEAIIMI